MAYYLGRDVQVYITTESDEAQVDAGSNVVTATSTGGSTVAATATITITDLTELNNGDKVNLIATDGTSHDFTVGEVAGGGTWIAETSNTISATNLSAAINANAKFSTTRSVAVITVTQATAGEDGNTTVTLTDTFAAGMTATSAFTGGALDPDYVSGTTFADNLDSSPAPTKVSDLTGVDVGLAVTDEDITYIGKKCVLKAEIKRETSISLTRKKSNTLWDTVFYGPTATNEGWTGSAAEDGRYGARWGVIESAADDWKIFNGLAAPSSVTDTAGDVTFGYRLHVVLKDSAGVISIPGCQITGHTVSLNADGTTEETMEFISNVTPKIGAALDYTRLTAADM